MNRIAEPVEALTLDDLEQLAWSYGGFIEPHGDGFVLLGARIDGRLIDRIGPVRA